jgi:hypothetical protein
MTTKHRQLFYILLAFLILATLQFVGTIINIFWQNQILANLLISGGFVINVTGVLIGLYNIYQGLALRKHTNIWIFIFASGIICLGFNVYTLAM